MRALARLVAPLCAAAARKRRAALLSAARRRVVPRGGGCGRGRLRAAAALRIKALRADALFRSAARSGRWFELAKALDALHAGGTPNTEVFEITGLTPVEQNAWKVQAAVYVSLEASPDFPRPLLAHFHDEQNATALAELRARFAAATAALAWSLH